MKNTLYDRRRATALVPLLSSITREIQERGTRLEALEQLLDSLAAHFGVDPDTPWRKLPRKARQGILFGTGSDEVSFRFERGDSRVRHPAQLDRNGSPGSISVWRTPQS